MVGVEGEDARVDARYVPAIRASCFPVSCVSMERCTGHLANHRMLKDDRVKGMEHRSLFAEKDLTDKVDRPIWEQFKEYQKKQPRPQ
jgi:hypothetical protein